MMRRVAVEASCTTLAVKGEVKICTIDLAVNTATTWQLGWRDGVGKGRVCPLEGLKGRLLMTAL